MLSLHETSIRKLKIFVTVVEQGGFSAAQSVLGTSAATISLQMKELEAQLGATLCHRGRAGFRLTEQGRAVYDAAQDLLSAFGNFNLSVAAIRDRLVGEIKIGMQPNVATNPDFHMADAVRRFQRRDNAVTFRIEEAGSAAQEARTLEGRYDLSIGFFPKRTPGLDYVQVFRERVDLYCSRDHPLAGAKDEAEARELLCDTALVDAGATLSRMLPGVEASVRTNAHTESMDAAALLVLSGQYAAYLPSHFAETWASRRLIVPVLPDAFGQDLDFSLITRRGGRGNNVVDTFIGDLLLAQGIT